MTGACTLFNETRDIWFFDLDKLIGKIQDNIVEPDNITNSTANNTYTPENQTLPIVFDAFQFQDTTSRFFPTFVKHSCSDNDYTVDFYTDPFCKIDLKMKQTFEKGKCNYIDLGGDK